MGDFDAEVEAEKRKISELFREIKSHSNESKDDKLNWMYKNPTETVDREEYLLGRNVDKALDAVCGRDAAQSQELTNFPKRIVSKEAAGSSEHVDLHKKMHEDPLLAIREKELAARKQLLNNPLKMMEIKKMIQLEKHKKAKLEKIVRKEQRQKIREDRVNRLILKELKKLNSYVNIKLLVEESTDSDSSSSSGEYKRSSKKKASSSSSSSEEETIKRGKLKKKIDSSDEDSDSRDERKRTKSSHGRVRRDTVDKAKHRGEKSSYKTSKRSPDVKNRRKDVKKKKRKSKVRDSSSEESDQPREKKKKKRRENNSDGVSKKRKSKVSDSSSDSSEESDPPRERKKKKRRENNSDEVPKRTSTKKNDSSPAIKHYGLSTLDGSKPRTEEMSIVAYKKKDESKSTTQVKKHVSLNDREKEALLKEMMDNAKWRKREREVDYEIYKQKKKKEEKIEDYDESFIKNQLSTMTGKGTMADRIKSKINNVQRAGGSMDKSFVRK